MRAIANLVATGFLACILVFLSYPTIPSQSPTKPYRVGVMGIASKPAAVDSRIWGAFVSALRELGYIEGKNIVFEWRYSEGRAERFPSLAQELTRLNVDLIVVYTTPAALAARAATNTIPVLFATAIDPVGAGLADSLARPGGNVTGLTTLETDLSGKRLELLKELLPNLSHVALLLNATNPANMLTLQYTEAAARRLRISTRTYEVSRPEDFTARFSEIAAHHPEALLVLGDALTFVHRKEVAEFALRTRLATGFDSREMVVAGGLLAYGPDYAEMFRRAAGYADKLLKGVSPAELPFEQVSKFQLVINMKAARVLGLRIPESVLLRADEVLE